ncbi:hypothetical protein ABPG74_011625 [Tetrahymena malaccensis]
MNYNNMNGNIGMGMGMPPNQQMFQQNQMQMQQQANLNHQADKKGRRTRTDPNNRNYICGCGKSYLSYPALYTHVKQKHDGKAPSDTKKPEKSRGQRGRPTTTNQQIEGNDTYEHETDNMSSDSNDALNVVEELVLCLYNQLNQDTSIILNENSSNSLQDLKDSFPTDIFDNASDYQVIQNHLEEVFNCEGYIDEPESTDGIVKTKCNLVFGLFIYSVGKHLKGYALKEIIFYCCLFRKALNEKGWKILQELGINSNLADQDQEFCEKNSAQNVLEISNEFITEILPTYLEKYQHQIQDYKIINLQSLESTIIKITQHFCNWLYARRYTNSMLERNEDETI